MAQDGLSATMAEKIGSSPVSCREGCGACCSQAVHVFWAEAAACVDAAKQAGYEIPKDKIQTQLGLIASGIDRKAYFANHQPCIFLTEQNACAIHSRRPVACRAVLVMSEPEACARDDGNVVRYDTRQDSFKAYQKIQRAQLSYGIDPRVGGPLQVVVASIIDQP